MASPSQSTPAAAPLLVVVLAHQVSDARGELLGEIVASVRGGEAHFYLQGESGQLLAAARAPACILPMSRTAREARAI